MSKCKDCGVDKDAFYWNEVRTNLSHLTCRTWSGKRCYYCVLKRKADLEHVRLGSKTLQKLKCPVCEMLFEQKRGNQLYCSRACRFKLWWANNKDLKPKEVRECLYCKKLTNRKKYCSYQCSRKGYYPPKPKRELVRYEHLCPNCNKTFQNTCLITKYCSMQCLRAYKQAHKKVIIRRSYRKTCLGCSQPFTTLIKKKRYCSDACCKKTGRKRNRVHRKSYEKLRELRKKQRVPKWANTKKIEKIYNNCPKDQQVDHIIPLNGANVCGFHVEYNLQYLTPDENAKKSNKFDGTYENLGWKSKVVD